MKINKCLKLLALAFVGIGYATSHVWAGLADDPTENERKSSTDQRHESDRQQNRKDPASSLRFEDLDKNNDSYLTREELPSYSDLQKQFDPLDTDKDRKLSREEFSKYKK